MKRLFFLIVLLATSLGYAQDEEREDDLGDVTDAFQTNFFEALKQKGIENYELALNALQRAQNEAQDEPDQLAVVYFERGKNYAALKRYDEAEVTYKQVLEIKVEQLDVMEALYDVYYQQKDYDKAVPLVRQLIRYDEDYKEDLANLLVRTKEYPQALELLDELDLKWGESAYRNALRRQIYKVTGDKEGAISSLEGKIDKSSKNEQDYLNLIYLYSEEGKTEKAFQTALELQRQIPKSELVHLALYKFYLDKGQADQAMLSMDVIFSSSQIDKENKFKVLNDFLTYVGKHPEMQSELDKVIGKFDGQDDGKVYEQLGDYHLSRSDRASALRFYRRGVEKDPNNFSLLKNTLLLQIDVKEFEPALELSNNGLELFPAQPLLYLLNGVVNIEMGNPERAIEVLETGLDFLYDDPKMERDFYRQLESAYNQKGNSKKAAEYARKASELKLDN
ncbi:tetratricopeptide repeat protein [Aureitalea marina]|uniref:Uncharacterized protein n=1 Tax=Aureitalea marina TaxID=930804 RepID=A0A2S7KSA6_9FLAO|nr:tetratricopeptide repeat protein [Aureitalea marina]PQB05515.1 hypothetical protein BST85_11880 [Aureitalea marina]